MHYNNSICGRSYADINPQTVVAVPGESVIHRDARRAEVYFAMKQEFTSPVRNRFLAHQTSVSRTCQSERIT